MFEGYKAGSNTKIRIKYFKSFNKKTKVFLKY